MIDILVRELEKNDFSYVLERERTFEKDLGFGFTEDHLKRILENKYNYFLIVEDINKNKVGYVFCTLRSYLRKFCLNKLTVDTIYVEEEYRKQRLGTKIITDCVNFMLSEKFKNYNIFKLCAEIEETNIASQKLFEKLGFKKKYLKINYYKSVSKNAFLYQRD